MAATISFFMLIASVVLLPIICVRLPADHFVAPSEATARPSIPFLVALFRNLLALILLALGVLMLFLPGQGLLTILVAITIAVFPGKYRLELLIIRRPVIFKSINWIRERYRRPAIIHPDQQHSKKP